MSDDNVTYAKLIESITPDIYQRMKLAVETGKWTNGIPLTQGQRAHCMQAVIAWEHQNLEASERTGFIERTKKTACESEHSESEAVSKPIKWQD